MFRDEEVAELWRLRAEGKQLAHAARRVGMSEKTARWYERTGKLPSQMKEPRNWRTRPDPFEEVWPELEALLTRAPGLEAKTLFEELGRKYPDRFQEGQLRSLQRRVRDWRALHGPAKEVFFDQVHEPGVQGQSDWTDMNELEITIGGEKFLHKLYHFELPYSRWEFAEVSFTESFEALSRGFQNAVWALGAVPKGHRTDNTTAATHNLKLERGRAFNERYQALMDHYDTTPSTNNVGKGNENGPVEKSHDLLKKALVQRLLLRGSRDFTSREAYERFLQEVVAARNLMRTERLTEERKSLKPLPRRRLDDFYAVTAVVTRTCVIRVGANAYSVPARLIGYEVDVRVYAERLEVRYGTKLVETLERLRGEQHVRINYRHLVDWLVRKPGAFQRYRYREELFPSVVFRRAYDVLLATSPTRASLEYVRLLKLAADTLESQVATVLEAVLAAGETPDSKKLSERVTPRLPASPELAIKEPDVARYDELLGVIA